MNSIINLFKNLKKYLNLLNLMQIINIYILFKIFTHLESPLDIEGILYLFLCVLPFITNIVMQIIIKKYEEFYSRDILIIILSVIPIELFIMGFIALMLLAEGR